MNRKNLIDNNYQTKESEHVCVEFACSPRAFVGFHQTLQLPPTIQ